MAPVDNPEDTQASRMSPAERPMSSWPVHRAPSSNSRRLLQLALPADPISASVARTRVRHWLAAWDWPGDQRDDIVLAVSEAVSNAIEHAYRDQPTGVIELRGGVKTTPGGQRRVTVIVRDYGRWRPIPTPHNNRRHGIPLMQACMDTVTIGQPADDRVGTWVVLRSRAVPPPAIPDNQDTQG